LVADALIRVDAQVLDQSGADGAAWDGLGYTTGPAELVAEMRRRQEELMAAVAERRRAEGSSSA
jgi:hypothetical protein